MTEGKRCDLVGVQLREWRWKWNERERIERERERERERVEREMAGRAAGGERKKHLKTSILFVCRSLASVGVGGLSAEDVRQGKFDQDEPRLQLWKALHDLVILSENKFCKKVARALRGQSREHAQLVIEYAAFQLDSMGCPFVSVFQHPSKIGSRRLLLALVWLIAKTNLVEFILERAVHNLKKSSLVTCCPTFSPEDTLFCHHTKEKFEAAYREAEKNVADMKSEGKNHSLWRAVDVKANQVLLLAGKVMAQVNTLLSSQSGYVRKMNRLRKAQAPLASRGKGEDEGKDACRSALSCFEIFLVSNKRRIEGYLKHLEDGAQTVVFLKEFAFHIHEFLSWITTVRDLHLAEELAKLEEEEEEGEEGMRNNLAGNDFVKGERDFLPLLVKIEEEEFERFEAKVQESILTRVNLNQTSDLIARSLEQLLKCNFEVSDAKARSPKEFSVEILSFLVHLQAEVGQNSNEQHQDAAGDIEEDLCAYKDLLLSLSKTQARIRAQHSLQFKQALDFMEKLDITTQARARRSNEETT